eukprot:750101-Hanusia_phi.AAC.1
MYSKNVYSKDLHTAPHLAKALHAVEKGEASRELNDAARLTSAVLQLEHMHHRESNFHPERQILGKAHEFTTTLQSRKYTGMHHDGSRSPSASAFAHRGLEEDSSILSRTLRTHVLTPSPTHSGKDVSHSSHDKAPDSHAHAVRSKLSRQPIGL